MLVTLLSEWIDGCLACAPNSPDATTSILGTAGSSSPPTTTEDPSRRRPPRNDSPPNDDTPPTEDDPSKVEYFLDVAMDASDHPMLQDTVEEATDVANDFRKPEPRKRRRVRDFISDQFTKRTRPTRPGNPLNQLLSDEGAAAQEGAARYLHEQQNRADNLATADFDYDAYSERRQEGPYSSMGGSDASNASSGDEADRASEPEPPEDIHPDRQKSLDEAQEEMENIRIRQQIRDQEKGYGGSGRNW